MRTHNHDRRALILSRNLRNNATLCPGVFEQRDIHAVLGKAGDGSEDVLGGVGASGGFVVAVVEGGEVGEVGFHVGSGELGEEGFDGGAVGGARNCMEEVLNQNAGKVEEGGETYSP
jgi:hypothetical protein